MDSEWNDNASTGSTDLVKLAEIQRLAQQLATVLAGNARTLDAVQSQAMELTAGNEGASTISVLDTTATLAAQATPRPLAMTVRDQIDLKLQHEDQSIAESAADTRQLAVTALRERLVQVEQENVELHATLAIVMDKFREQATLVKQERAQMQLDMQRALKKERHAASALVEENVLLQRRIDHMLAVMHAASMAGVEEEADDRSIEEQQEHFQLSKENAGLREMLNLTVTQKQPMR